MPSKAPTTESPTSSPTSLPEHVQDLEDKLKECIDADTMPEGCITWLDYCNTYPDLQAEYCGGSECTSVVEESLCRLHYITTGASAGRKCAGLPYGCKDWLDYGNYYPDLKSSRCGGICDTTADAESIRGWHLSHGYKNKGRTCPWGVSRSDANQVIENAEGVGGWGGSCSCPDGQVYEVGADSSDCGSLACVGGISGTCIEHPGPWSNRKVICAPAGEGAALESESSNTLALSALNVSSRNDISFVTIAIYGFAMIGCASMLSLIHQKASGSDTFKPISNQNDDEI